MDFQNYDVIKGKKAASFKLLKDGLVEITVKQFDGLTGEELEPVINKVNVAGIDKVLEESGQSIEFFTKIHNNALTLKQDLINFIDPPKKGE